MPNQIETERLLLKPPEPADAPRITELMQEEGIPKRLARAPWPYTLSDAEGWIAANLKARRNGREYSFMIHRAKAGLIGSCGLVVRGRVWELGFWCGKPWWGQGFVTEAAEALLAWARDEHDQDAFIAGHIADNLGSGRVLEKLGFSPVGEKKMYVRALDCDVVAVRYALNATTDEALLNGH